MLKKIQKEVENLRIKVYSGLSAEDTDIALYEIEQMLFKEMDEQLILPVVSNHVCVCTKTTQVNKINDSWICTECNRPIQQQQIVANVIW